MDNIILLAPKSICSTVSIVIGTGNICRDKMVCERLAGNKGDITKTAGYD